MVAKTFVGSGLALWSGLLTAVLCSADQQVLANGALLPTAAADPAVQSSYSSLFADWEMSTKFHNRAGLARCTGCNQAPGCCPQGGWLQLPTVRPPSSFRTPKLPAPTTWKTFVLPSTVTSQSPLRTTIFRPSSPTSDTSVPDSTSDSTSDSTPEPTPESIHEMKKAVVAASANKLEDITSSYYDFTVNGQHPFEIPLIVEDGTGTPVTLLAFADTAHSMSFISASLVAQLNMTSKVVSEGVGTLSPAQLSVLLGIATSTPGDLYLDIMVGRNDRRMAGSRFIVFEPINEVEGPLFMDISLGMDFLNGAGALQLTDEYAGIGAKAGLGIVVQRVFADGSSGLVDAGAKVRVRDEL